MTHCALELFCGGFGRKEMQDPSKVNLYFFYSFCNDFLMDFFSRMKGAAESPPILGRTNACWVF